MKTITTKSHSERLARVLDILKEKSGCKKPTLKNIIASINRKERTGALPPNKGYAFAAGEVKTALSAAGLAHSPFGNDFLMNQFCSSTERAERWINAALAA